MSPTLALILCIATFLPSGESIKCWVCSSDIDRNCADPFNTSQSSYLVTDCDRARSHTPYIRTTAVCKKVKQTVSGVGITIRSCTWKTESDPDGPCSTATVHPSTKLEYCSTCNTDECNSATSHTAALIAVLLTPALALFTRQ